MSVPAEHFDAMYAASDDPWGFRSRWYEARKRRLMLAALPREHYLRAFEPGCANGETSVELAARCQHLLCCDGSQRAVQLARERLAGHANAHVHTALVPQDWPAERFDLIVFSELGYYLDEPDLIRLLQRCAGSLDATGHLLACHWRHPIGDGPLDGGRVHELLHQHLPLERLVLHEERDFLLEVWGACR